MEVTKTVFAWIGVGCSTATFIVLCGIALGELEHRWDRRRHEEDLVAELRDEMVDW